LTIDDGGGGARFSFRLVAAFDVKRMMNAIQHAIALPPNEISGGLIAKISAK
jgi:hypothetical protein